MTLPRTPSQTVGPYYSIGLSRRTQHELVPSSSPRAIALVGRLLDGDDGAIDGMIELWDHVAGAWGRCGTDGSGAFRFTIAKPDAAGRDAPRLDVYVFARGLLRHQLTRIYFPDEASANAADPLLSSIEDEALRHTLIARPLDGVLAFDIHLQGERQTAFLDV